MNLPLVNKKLFSVSFVILTIKTLGHLKLEFWKLAHLFQNILITLQILFFSKKICSWNSFIIFKEVYVTFLGWTYRRKKQPILYKTASAVFYKSSGFLFTKLIAICYKNQHSKGIFYRKLMQLILSCNCSYTSIHLSFMHLLKMIDIFWIFYYNVLTILSYSSNFYFLVLYLYVFLQFDFRFW